MGYCENFLKTLPVGEIVSQIGESLRKNPRLVITAPPGSGKSTLVPLAIADAIPQGKVIMLEPRRAAARQIALRMASMIGERIGATVGYRMRFESKVSQRTRIEVVTDGVMERMLVDNPTLDGVSAVIFDEFHERSLTADLTLALTLEAQNIVRPDLRVVIMSATINADELCGILKASHLEAKGKMFDVGIVYCDDTDSAGCVSAVASVVRKAYREQEGNILAFLPGQGEIMQCASELADTLPESEVLPLYGTLPAEEQYRAIEYNPAGRRKIVLATPVAETSLTIEGIRTVVDSGLYRTVKYDPSTGLGLLETQRISLDMARQRAGRAGRLSEGVCYRLWSKATEHRMSESRIPEILRADLSGMLLDIAAWGGGRPENLPWVTAPPSAHLAEALKLLSALGAVDGKGIITPAGRRMALLPCHPRIAKMLTTASDNFRRSLAADIAAVLEEKDPVTDETDADINTRIELLRRFRRHGNTPGRWKRILSISAQYHRLLKTPEDNSDVSPDDTGALIAMAFPERVAVKFSDGVYRLPGGENVSLNDADNLTRCNQLAIASMDRRIFLASPVSVSTLKEMAHLHENVSWNSREGRLIARNELRIGVLVIESRDIENPTPALVAQVISRAAVKEGRSMFDFNDETLRLQQRIATVARWHPELNIRDVSIEALLQTAPEWLPLYIGKATTRQGLHKIDMCEVIRGVVGYGLMPEIDRIAPTYLRLPGGRNARIDYRSGNDVPVVSARLQDCFGLFDTPRLDSGKRPVLMELLSPGFKPVQLTQDLRGFWSATYFEVRKELRRRYPKHRWPDDPLSPQ